MTYTSTGKQILRDGAHFADMVSVAEAERVTRLLNPPAPMEQIAKPSRVYREEYFRSLKIHQIKCLGIVGLGLPVMLTYSDNKSIRYPARGVLVIIEQAVDLSVNVAVFHHERTDGSLGPPVTAKNPIFNYF